MLTAVSSVALFQHLQLQKMVGLANDIFYGMKALELHVANLESDLERDREDIRGRKLRAEITESRRKLARMREDYNAYARELQTGRLIPPDSEELLILRLARVFGETEIAVPDGFIAKVKEYIKKWQSSQRLENAIRRLRENHYARPSAPPWQARTSRRSSSISPCRNRTSSRASSAHPPATAAPRACGNSSPRRARATGLRSAP